MNNDSSYFLPSSEYKCNLNYTLTLRNKKGKHFEFEYSLINDTTLIGEFWVKDQHYVRFNAPNYIFGYETNYGDYASYELLGVYHLKK